MIADEVFQRFAHALDRVDCDDDAAALVSALQSVVPFFSAIAIAFHKQLGPVSLYDTFDDASAQAALKRFLASTYVLNPVYNAFLKGLPKGVYMMRDIAPDDYFASDLFRKNAGVRQSAQEELGYITPGWPEGMEEVVLAMPIDADTLGEISLSRKKADGGFSEADVGALKSTLPLVEALFRRVCARQRRLVLPEAPKPKPVIFGDRLTARELEVAMMILQGHSTESIGLNLTLSLATVKTHRNHAYRKLQISSQAELFALFLRETGAVRGLSRSE